MQKRSFIEILRFALTSTAGLVHVAPKYVEVERTPFHRLDIHDGRVSPSNVLTARGSVALSRLPVVTEEEMQARKKRALAYDFSTNY